MTRKPGGMRDGLATVGRDRYRIMISLGYVVDPATGRRRLKQQWSTFHGTREEAKAHRAELLTQRQKGTLVRPTRATLGEWLTAHLQEHVRVALGPNTFASYAHALDKHILPALGATPLQKLRPGHVKEYLLERREKLSPATLQLHRSIISSALESAVEQDLLARNVARFRKWRLAPARSENADAKVHCWSTDEARRFLAAAKQSGSPQVAAFFGLLLDAGCRRGEALALRWADADFERGQVTFDETLISLSTTMRKRLGVDGPQFGPVKNGRTRTVTLGAQTLALLREHRKHQAELKMANRAHYHDDGLCFAREWDDGDARTLGLPLSAGNFAARALKRLAKAAGVRVIKVHGLRHTVATLLLTAGQPVHVVAARLGHTPAVLMQTYAHVLDAHQQQAAQTLSALLHG